MTSSPFSPTVASIFWFNQALLPTAWAGPLMHSEKKLFTLILQIQTWTNMKAKLMLVEDQQSAVDNFKSTFYNHGGSNCS